jgi:hypothetical protein
MQIDVIGKYPAGKDRPANRQIGDFASLRGHQRREMKEARQPIGRRAKFREETPVTRQDEEPNFTLGPTMQRSMRKVKLKQHKHRIVFKHPCLD